MRYKNLLFLGLIVSLLFLVGCVGGEYEPVESEEPAEEEAPAETPEGEEEVDYSGQEITIQEEIIVVNVNDNSFEPKTLRIQKGSTVTFLNIARRDVWPASNIHPTHTVYPGSDITKCNTPEEATIFDACRALSPGERYVFTFNEVGEWQYHDHLRASVKGTVIVE